MAALDHEFPNDLQMEKVDGEGKPDTCQKSRSLVFRITRKSQKPFVTPDSTTDDSQSPTFSRTEKDFGHDLQNLKIRIPRSAILPSEIKPNDFSTSQKNTQDELKENCEDSVTVEKPEPVVPPSVVRLPELRRTSRRIILRVQKEMVTNSQSSVKEGGKQRRSDVENNKHAEVSGPSLRENPASMKYVTKPGRKKRGRAATRVPLLKERRTGGRSGRLPRGRTPSNSSFEVKRKSSRGAGAKALSWPKFETKNSTVWTLVPKTFFESEFFRKHVVNMHYSTADSKKFRSKNVVIPPRPKKIPLSRVIHPVPHVEGPELKFKNSYERQSELSHLKQAIQSKRSTRPTVIYFKTRNSSKIASGIRSAGHKEDDCSHSELAHTSGCGENQSQNPSYRGNNYHNFNAITFDYACGRKLLVSDSNIYPVLQGLKIQPPAHDARTSEMDRYNLGAQDVINYKFDDYERVVSSFDGIDTLSRSIIVDSMRILYDDEAVLK